MNRQTINVNGPERKSSEWARIPRTGETLEGLFRSEVFRLIRQGQIRSAAILKPGARRIGMRLVHLPSLRDWIASHAAAEGGEA